MNRNAVLFVGLSLLLPGAILIVGDRYAWTQQSEIQRKSLLQQDSTISGYQAITNIVEIPAGVREVRHTHPGPLVGYILEGTLTLEHEGRPTAVYQAGDAFLVDTGKIHQGINTGDMPVKILATLIVEKGKPTTTPCPLGGCGSGADEVIE